MGEQGHEAGTAFDWAGLFAEVTSEGVLIHEGGRVLRVNPALARLLGRVPEELVGMPVGEFTVPADRPRMLRHMAERNEAPLLGTAVRRDGSTFPCEIRGRTVRVGDRTLRVVLVRDVGERVAMEDALRSRERELAALARHSPDVITRYDREHRVRFMSPAVERETGVPAAWFTGKRPREFGFPAALLARWEAITGRVFATGQPEETEFEFVGPDGMPRHYHTRVVPEQDDAGAVAHVLTTTRDITALKRAEQSARDALATLQGLLDQTLTGIYVIQDGRFAYANPRLAEIFGFERVEEVLALPALDALVHPDDRALVSENVRRRMAGEQPAVHYAFRGRRRDGSIVHVEVHGSTATHQGRPAVVGTLLDISERLVLEERLRQSQQMEALGQLAGGVAHDFNNILAAILGYAEVLRDEIPGDGRLRSDVAEIVRAAERGAGVTRQLLAFSRRQALETEVLDLAEVVRALGAMLAQLVPRAIALRLPTAGACAPVRATRGQLEQIVMNLALNARDAMPDGGTLTLDVRAAETGGGSARAVLTVRDTGHGMPPEVRARAFEPFFTTKRHEQGTGLGLATVYGLVRQFDGEVHLDSTEGAGTTVTVSFPLAPPGPVRGAAAVRAPRTGRGRRILLVEDEPAIRAFTRRVLERAGYEVREAAHGAAGVDVLRSGERVDLLLTDAAMPGLGGVELARAAAALRPGLPLVLMSGYAELSGAAVRADGTAEGVAECSGFIEKPFTADRLLTLVADVLERRTG